MAKVDSPDSRTSVKPGARKRPQATVSSRYLLPLTTAMVVGACFVVYYLTYVQQHREYLLNRDYRVLATLGEQISQTLSNQVKILQSYVYAFEGGEFYDFTNRISTYRPTGGENYKPFEQGDRLAKSGGASTLSAEIRSFAPRLNHVRFNHVKPKIPEKDLVKPALVRLDGEWSFQLAAVDHDGDHEASATISLQDVSQSFSPAISETFDDVLLADKHGTIVFQEQRIGPHFSSLSDLVKNTVQTNASGSEADKDNNSKADSAEAHRGESGQLIETELAGVTYMVFVEPIAIDLNFSHSAAPPQRFTLLGLVRSREFQWQSLAISYQAIIFLSSAFLLLCLSTPIIKVLFLNERGRLPLRDIVMLPLFFAMIAVALTAVCLQTIYFNLRHDDTDEELRDFSVRLQANIKNEITAMRAQLVEACGTKELRSDLDFRKDGERANVIRTNVLKTQFQDHSFPTKYANFSNIFWTDSEGRQQVKWSPRDNATPLIDVRRLDFFRKLYSDNEYFFLGKNEPFRLDSVLPPNQDEYVAVLGMRMLDCPPASLTFAAQNVGTASSAQNVTLSNTGDAPLAIKSIGILGEASQTPAMDFAQTNNCGSSLAAEGNCRIAVTFSPIRAGSRRATLVIQDDAPGNPQSVSLSGAENQATPSDAYELNVCSSAPDEEYCAKPGFAFLTARPLSLVDPTLPLGVGFALVDNLGQVLFHSDKYRNNRENILVETSNDRELTASLYGHANKDNFLLDYRGNEVRARVVPIAGVYQSPWSLIVYKDSRYVQTYDLEVLTMAGVLLIGYLGVPALVVFLFYLFARPLYVPGWLWPSESASPIYRFQIVAGTAMLVLSAVLISLRPIEESLYAAAASSYATIVIVFWSTLRDKPSSLGKTVFGSICGLAAIAMVTFALWKRWWWSVPIGLILVLIVFPIPWERHVRALGPLVVDRVPPAAARRQFERLSYRSLYTIRALLLLTVVGILPPLSFFRNSMRLEDRLYIRAAQLHAATLWNSRQRKIASLFEATPGIKNKTAGLGTPDKPADRCSTALDFYLDSYFKTTVDQQAPLTATPGPSAGQLDEGFLQFAHFLHHSFNQIGAEALGVFRNPVPEAAYVSTSLAKPGESLQSEFLSLARWVRGAPRHQKPGESGEWEWKWAPKDKDRPGRPLQLWVQEGADVSNTCAAPAGAAGVTPEKTYLVVSSAVPSVRDSAWPNVFTCLAVTAVMSLLFRLVTGRIFLFDLGKPLSQSVQKLRDALKGETKALVLTAVRQDWSPEFAGGEASRIDVRALAAEPDWGEKFDTTKLRAGGTAVVENFDWELASPEFNRQRLTLTERLVARSGKVILVSAVDPSPFLIEPCASEAGGDAGRWAAVLGAFTRINLGHKSSGVLSEEIEKELPTLWQECSVQPELRRIGEEIWRDAVRPEAPSDQLELQGIGEEPWLARNPRQPLEPEQVVSEVGDRAVHYYYLEWRSCTEEECFVLAGLARDGTVNPRNTAGLRQLLRRGLIVREPQFRIMNESFRRFVLTQAVSMREVWDDEAAGSGWGMVRGPLATALVLVGLFLLSTQHQFLQTSSGLLTAAGGCVAALLQLIGVAQGKSSSA